MDIESVLAERLRRERETRGWTLADLATRSGVSRAMLSKIERREASPTAALLGRLSAAFGLTMSQLFATAESATAGRVTRAAEQPAWQDPATGFLRRSLTPPAGTPDEAPLELIWGEMPPGAAISYPASSYAFIQDQQLVIMSGNLSLEIDGTTHELAAGDCIRFGPPAEVTFRNPGAARCRYVVALLRRAGLAGSRN